MMEALITSWEEYRKVRDALRADKGPVLLTGGVQIHKAQFLAALCREAERGPSSSPRTSRAPSASART